MQRGGAAAPRRLAWQVQPERAAFGSRGIAQPGDASSLLRVQTGILLLVCAAASLVSSRGRATAAPSISRFAAQINKATSVVIVGGGPVGVEVAAEILHHFPAKKVGAAAAAGDCSTHKVVGVRSSDCAPPPLPRRSPCCRPA